MEPEGSLPHSQVPATCPYQMKVLLNCIIKFPWNSQYLLSFNFKLFCLTSQDLSWVEIITLLIYIPQICMQ